MSEEWIADRMHQIDASGIRRVFDLAATMTDPVNLSIGQPHFDTPQPVKDALCQAVQEGRNSYSQTQGIAPLLKLLQDDVDERFGHSDRQAFVTSGTSGGLMLALCTLLNPGDEVIVFDPWFVMYRHLATLAGANVVQISTYPDFRICAESVEAAITDRTKVILFNSPGNPTGAVASKEEVQALAELAAKHNIALTGHRLGYIHGPSTVIQQMLKLQQFTFVCAPQPVQWAGLTAWELDLSEHFSSYGSKRDLIVSELQEDFQIHGGQGAFYLFLKAPWGTGTEFVTEAIQNNLLIIPGNVFSPQDTHFRVSFAAEDETLRRGAEILRKVAKHG